MKRRITIIVCGLLSALAITGRTLADYPIEVIELKAALLEEILPVVRPLAGADATVTGMGNTLIIKAPPERVREIRKLLLEIDRPPRQLTITVSNAGDESIHSSGYSASADVSVGDTRVGINSPGRSDGDSRARLDVHGHDAQLERNVGQQVQVLEGRPAWIAAGTRVPVYGGYPPSTGFRDDSSGFYVVPRVGGGGQVTLEIHQRDDRPGRIHGTRDIQRAATVVTGRLGEWILIGGIDDTGNSRQEGIGRALNRETASTRQIRVRVECPDCAAD